MIYLASPYSHPNPAVREERYREACRAAVALLMQGRIVFSPIAHSHPLTEFGLPMEWQFWERIDREHLWRCDSLVVLMLDGQLESAGVAAEIQIAEELGLLVEYLDPLSPAMLAAAMDVLEQ